MQRIILNIIVFLVLSYYGYKDFFEEGFYEQDTHEAVTTIAIQNYKNAGAVWFGCTSYFNDNPVTDLMYKTRDCRGIQNRGEFYPGHNKYDFLKDTTDVIIGGIWKPNTQEKEYLKDNYSFKIYRNVKIYFKNISKLTKREQW